MASPKKVRTILNLEGDGKGGGGAYSGEAHLKEEG